MRVLLGLLIPALAGAAPFDLTHQGRLLDSGGAPLQGTHRVDIALYGPSGTLNTWSFPTLTIQGGYYSVVLDEVDSAWFSANVDVGISVDLGPELTPRQTLASVPRAQFAAVAEAIPVATTTLSGACSPDGAVSYERTTGRLRVCDGNWTTPGVVQLVESNGARIWSTGDAAKSCYAYRYPADGFSYAGATGDGLYRLDVDGAGPKPAFNAWCEMEDQGGGWTLVASVIDKSPFWIPGSYTTSNSARVQTLGSPSVSANYLLHLERWRDLLALRAGASEIRVSVRQVTDNAHVELGRLVGMQMQAGSNRFTNPTAAFNGFGAEITPAVDACVIQYNSRFSDAIIYTYFDNSDTPCAEGIGWNGSCGYPSLGHQSGLHGTAADRFAHACSRSGTYYCATDRTNGPPSSPVTICEYKDKYYWIR